MIHDRPPKNWKRPSIPLEVQVAVLKRALCKVLHVDTIELDHRPALWQRHYDDEINNTIPGANNPNHIEAIGKEDHRRRTHGTKATSYGSDSHERAKERRLTTPKKAKGAALMGTKRSGWKKKLNGRIERR